MWDLPETRYAERDGVHLAYQVVGPSPPRLAFVPEWLSHIEAIWDHPPAASFLRRLASMGSVVLFNRRGTGLSDPVSPHELPTLEQWMEDLEIVLDEVGAERVTLVACAGGGPMCALFCAAHPERVDRLVYVNSFARLLAAPDHPIGLDPAMRSTIVDDVSKNWGKGGASLAWVAPSAADDEQARTWLARYERLSAPPAMAGAIISMALDMDVRSALPSVRAPTLVVHRTGNRFAPFAHGVAVANAIPGATLLEIPGEDCLFWAGDTAPLLSAIEQFVSGNAPTRHIDDDRVFVTMMFTDIVHSTEKVAEIGDHRWNQLLEDHDRIIRSSAKTSRGSVLKTTGDGALAVFEGPARAVACAMELRERVDSLGLKVRVGLHSGEVHRRGNDIAGLAVHIAARISALGGPDDVLASLTVRDLAAGAGYSFDEKGTFKLRGVPGEWPVFSIAPGRTEAHRVSA